MKLSLARTYVLRIQLWGIMPKVLKIEQSCMYLNLIHLGIYHFGLKQVLNPQKGVSGPHSFFFEKLEIEDRQTDRRTAPTY